MRCAKLRCTLSVTSTLELFTACLLHISPFIRQVYTLLCLLCWARVWCEWLFAAQDSQGVRSFAESLRTNSTLEMLDMQGCELNEECVSLVDSNLAGSYTLDLIRFDRCEIPVQILNGTLNSHAVCFLAVSCAVLFYVSALLTWMQLLSCRSSR